MEIVTIETGGVAHGGYCVGRLNSGKVVMIRGALPNEKVRVEITSQRSKVAYGRVLEVLCASADRVNHVWPEGAAKDLGGVELGHVAYAAQLEWKKEVLSQALVRNGSEDLLQEIRCVSGGLQVSASTCTGRTRMGFTVTPDGDLGMYEFAGHALHSVRTMPLMVSQLQQLDWLKEGFVSAELGLAPFTRVRLVFPSDSSPVLFAHGEVFDTGLRPTSPRVRERVEAQRMSNNKLETISRRYRVYAGSFWQTDWDAPATLVGALLDSIGDVSGWDVTELYSGSGLFTLFLAEIVGERGWLQTVESDGPAVKSAMYNLRKAGVSGAVDVLRGRVDAKLVRDLSIGLRVSEGTLVVADPPRSGLGKSVAQAICEKEPLRIALFSCDPVSCARDLEYLRGGGYRVVDFRAFDLFPHTFHVETWALLEKI